MLTACFSEGLQEHHQKHASPPRLLHDCDSDLGSLETVSSPAFLSDNVMDFSDHAEAFIKTVPSTRDVDPKTQLLRLGLVNNIETLVKAWRIVWSASRNSPPNKPAFEQTINRLEDDNAKIISDLSKELANAELAYRTAKKQSRWYKPHSKLGRPLYIFLHNPKTALRQEQILYATAVVDLICSTVLY